MHVLGGYAPLAPPPSFPGSLLSTILPLSTHHVAEQALQSLSLVWKQASKLERFFFVRACVWCFYCVRRGRSVRHRQVTAACEHGAHTSFSARPACPRVMQLCARSQPLVVATLVPCSLQSPSLCRGSSWTPRLYPPREPKLTLVAPCRPRSVCLRALPDHRATLKGLSDLLCAHS